VRHLNRDGVVVAKAVPRYTGQELRRIEVMRANENERAESQVLFGFSEAQGVRKRDRAEHDERRKERNERGNAVQESIGVRRNEVLFECGLEAVRGRVKQPGEAKPGPLLPHLLGSIKRPENDDPDEQPSATVVSVAA